MKKAGPCIYCRHLGAQSEFSVEHVIQESIGGTLRLPRDFVCKDGNVLVSRCEFFEVVEFTVVFAEEAPSLGEIDERLRADF